MKTVVIAVIAAALGFGAAYWLGSHQLATQNELHAARESAWQAERAVENAQERPAPIAGRTIAPAPQAPISAAKPTPAEIIDRLRLFKSNAGTQQNYALRRMLYYFEELVMAGPAALPAIRDFLSSGDNAYFALSPDSRTPLANKNMLVPYSLRIGLLETARRIDGSEAEALLAETLTQTARGEEIVWLTTNLQDIAPEKYRDSALSAARRLAEMSPAADGRSGDRDLGFMLLAELRDASYVDSAQQQVIRGDGQVDRAALKYLQQTLGQQVVPLMAQLYNDTRISDPQVKEPFARVALNYVGADQQANEFYVKAINDMNLSNGQRKNLIEDLNQDGFANRKNLTQNDLPLINNRMALIEQLAPSMTDPVNLAAMKEAYKDLVKMRERAMRPPTGAGVLPPGQVR
jgi:hypothetical protein